MAAYSRSDAPRPRPGSRPRVPALMRSQNSELYLLIWDRERGYEVIPLRGHTARWSGVLPDEHGILHLETPTTHHPIRLEPLAPGELWHVWNEWVDDETAP